MTELLKDTLNERAGALTSVGPDLDAIMKQGRTRVRRRRALAGTLACTALVGAALVLPAQLDGLFANDNTSVAGSEATQLSWAQGSVIHAGGEKIDVGREINAYVETVSGYAFTDAAGKVYLAQPGGAKQLGRLDDDSGTRDLITDGRAVAWLDITDGQWSFVVSENASEDLRVPVQLPAHVVRGGDELTNPEWQLRNRTRVMALDDRTLYAGDERGLLAIDREDGTVRVLSTDPDLRIHDVEAGRLLVVDEDPRTGEESTFVVSDLADDRTPLAVRDGDLSPGARYVMSEDSTDSGDDFTLVSVADGTSFAPDQKADYGFFLGYAWIDADRYLAFGLQRGKGDGWEAEAMTCSASERTCGEPVRLPAGEGVELGFQLPIGEHIG